MLLEREVRVDSKRRSALPVEVMKEAGINVGDNLVISVAGPGNIILRTRAAILADVRDEIDAGFLSTPDATDAIESMRAERENDANLSDARLGVDEPRDPAIVQERGAALLERLGL